jgi:hypothetical protein
MSIKKVILEVVVLLPDSDADTLSGMSLSQIDEEMSTGSWIGMTSQTSVEDVPPAKLRDELLAIGNDGTFFETDA